MIALVAVPTPVWVAMLVAICACVAIADRATDRGDLGVVRACGVALMVICALAFALAVASSPDEPRHVDWNELHETAREVQD